MQPTRGSATAIPDRLYRTDPGLFTQPDKTRPTTIILHSLLGPTFCRLDSTLVTYRLEEHTQNAYRGKQTLPFSNGFRGIIVLCPQGGERLG
jgi:hypothetical protein